MSGGEGCKAGGRPLRLSFSVQQRSSRTRHSTAKTSSNDLSLDTNPVEPQEIADAAWMASGVLSPCSARSFAAWSATFRVMGIQARWGYVVSKA